MSSFTKKYPRAKVSRHPNLNGWVIDLIQRETAKPKRVAATYSSIPWADRAARAKLGLKPRPLLPTPAPAPEGTPWVPAPVLDVEAPAPAVEPVAVTRPVDQGCGICDRCIRPMRPAGSKPTDYPGAVLRQRANLCQSCNQKAKR